MTQVSSDDVRHLARLSGLALSEDEVESMRQDIAAILTYVAQLDELDTTGAEPTYQVTDLENIWREDEIARSEPSREELLALAPETLDHQVKVPKVL